MKKQVVLTALLFTSAGLLPVHADRTLIYTNPQDASGEMVLTVTGNGAAMRIPDQEGKSTRIVFDKSADKLYIVMDSEQQYMDMDDLIKPMAGIASALTGAMQNMSEDDKKSLNDMLGKMGVSQPKAEAPAAPTITSTGASDTVAGISCDVVVMKTEQDSSEICVAAPADAGLSDSDFAVLQRMMEKQADVARKASEMLGSNAIDLSPGKLDGVPLRVKQLDGSSGNTELLRTSSDVDAAAVAVPTSYSAIKMMGG